jgi:hypothetical protein
LQEGFFFNRKSVFGATLLANFVCMIRKIYHLFIVFFFLSSCEKDITIKLDPTSTDVVVDASIENDKYPQVILSKSLEYFAKLEPSLLTSSYIHDAIVTISNGSIRGQLNEDSAAMNDSLGLVVYFYTFSRTYSGPKFKGEFNTRYNLEIQTGNKTYTATTTIPGLNKYIDSLWWVKAPAAADSGLVNLKARVVDPPGYGNYTRYFTSVNNGPYYPGLNSVFDDQITDGTTYTVTVDKGVNRNFPIDINDYSFFNRGDSVEVKLANIDKATYDFWRTMEYNYQSVGNPFSTPTVVISNVTNGALGYFGGYAAQYKGLIIPY